MPSFEHLCGRLTSTTRQFETGGFPQSSPSPPGRVCQSGSVCAAKPSAQMTTPLLPVGLAGLRVRCGVWIMAQRSTCWRAVYYCAPESFLRAGLVWATLLFFCRSFSRLIGTTPLRIDRAISMRSWCIGGAAAHRLLLQEEHPPRTRLSVADVTRAER